METDGVLEECHIRKAPPSEVRLEFLSGGRRASQGQQSLLQPLQDPTRSPQHEGLAQFTTHWKCYPKGGRRHADLDAKGVHCTRDSPRTTSRCPPSLCSLPASRPRPLPASPPTPRLPEVLPRGSQRRRVGETGSHVLRTCSAPSAAPGSSQAASKQHTTVSETYPE